MRRYRAAGALLISLLVSAALQAKDVPAYIRQLEPATVKRLDQVSSGKAKLAEALPRDWIDAPDAVCDGCRGNDDPAGVRIVASWNGAAWDPGAHVVYHHGGGHSDSAWNGIHRYDFNGDAMPAGWSLVDGSWSDARDTLLTSEHYADGRPTAVHTYDGLVFDPESQSLYRFGGSIYGSGSCIDWVSVFSLGDARWRDLDPMGGAAVCSWVTMHDPVSRRVLVAKPGGYEARIFDLQNRRWAGGTIGVPRFQIHRTASYSPELNIGLIIGAKDGTGQPLLRADFNKRRSGVHWKEQRSTGDTEILGSYGPGIVYDADRDVFWAMDLTFPGHFDSLWKLDPHNWHWTRYRLGGDVINQTGVLPRGTWGRLGWLQGWDALAVYHQAYDVMYVIRLPAG